MKLFDAFSGYGGFTLAADVLGIETVAFSEVDKYANAVLAFRFPEVKNYGCVKGCREQDIPSFDILSGGSPCQDFSIAGGRDGLGGGRSGLFFRFIEIAKHFSPRYIIWENVRGTLSATKGWDFATILNEVASAGYDVQWGIVNGKWFTPQNRERVFIVGYPRGEPRREIFPIRGDEQEVRKVGRDVAFCIDANYFKGPSPMGHQSKRRQLIQVGNVDTKGNNSLWGRVYDPEGLGVTLKAEGGGTGAKTGLYRVALTERRTEEDFRIRKLTPLECERLMGLPDEWTRYGIMDGEVVEISNTQRYKMCGNGVIPQVVEEILRRLLWIQE